jgi:hypothetical protein
VKPSTNGRVQEELDTQSHTAFPALESSSPGSVAAPTQTAWVSAPRIKPATSRQPVVSDSFALQVDLSKAAGKDGKPASVGEAMKQVMSKYKVKLEASTNHKTQTTFHIRAESQKELDKAKRTLFALLSPAVGIHSSLIFYDLRQHRRSHWSSTPRLLPLHPSLVPKVNRPTSLTGRTSHIY